MQPALHRGPKPAPPCCKTRSRTRSPEDRTAWKSQVHLGRCARTTCSQLRLRVWSGFPPGSHRVENKEVNETVNQTHIRIDPHLLFHVLYYIMISNRWHTLRVNVDTVSSLGACVISYKLLSCAAKLWWTPQSRCQKCAAIMLLLCPNPSLSVPLTLSLSLCVSISASNPSLSLTHTQTTPKTKP